MQRISLLQVILLSLCLAVWLQFALVGTARADDCLRYLQNPANFLTGPRGLLEDCQRTPGFQALLTSLVASVGGGALGTALGAILAQMTGQAPVGSFIPTPGASSSSPSGPGTAPPPSSPPPPPTASPPTTTEIYSGTSAINVLVQNGLLTPDPVGGYRPTPALTNWLNNPLAGNLPLSTSQVVGTASTVGGQQTHTQTIDLTSLNGIAITSDPTKGPIKPGDIVITVGQTAPSGWQPAPPEPPVTTGSTPTTGTTAPPTGGSSTGGTPPTGGSSTGGGPPAPPKPPKPPGVGPVQPPLPPAGGTPPTGGTPPPPVAPPAPPAPPTGGTAPQPPTAPADAGQSSESKPAAPPTENMVTDAIKNVVDQISKLPDPVKFIDDNLKQLQEASSAYQKAVENQKKAEAEGKKQDTLDALISGGFDALESAAHGKSADEAIQAGVKGAAEKVDPKVLIDQASNQSGLSPDVVKALLQVDPKTWQSIRDALPKASEPPAGAMPPTAPKTLPK